MKYGIKGVKFAIKSPNEELNIEVTVEDVTFEAEAPELKEIYTGVKDIVGAITECVEKAYNACNSFYNPTKKGDEQ